MQEPEPLPKTLYVDAKKGSDRNPGSKRKPLKSLSGALAKLPPLVHQSVTIEIAAATLDSTGGHRMPERSLQLMREMPPQVWVTFRGNGEERPILAWPGERRMIHAVRGNWRFDNLQIGNFSTRQRRGIMVEGPALVELKDIRFRLRSHSDAGIYVHRGGKVLLKGAIELNEHLDADMEESFCGIIADDHGLVRFVEREGAFLKMGNGSLSAQYYGCIRLGCETAEITSRAYQSNNLAANNGGRVDLHNTKTTLLATNPKNTPIGLEHDGHILAEDAHIIIKGENESAIALQKASTFTCNDIELKGTFKTSMWASSGSMFVGGFLTDVNVLDAKTGAGIHVERMKGKVLELPKTRSGGQVTLPD